MKYEPPKLPLPKTGKTIQIYIANDKRSAAAYTDKPVASVHVEQPFKGRDWSTQSRVKFSHHYWNTKDSDEPNDEKQKNR